MRLSVGDNNARGDEQVVELSWEGDFQEANYTHGQSTGDCALSSLTEQLNVLTGKPWQIPENISSDCISLLIHVPLCAGQCLCPGVRGWGVPVLLEKFSKVSRALGLSSPRAGGSEQQLAIRTL